MNSPFGVITEGKTFSFCGPYLLTLEKVVQEIQDADGFLLGCRRPGDGVFKAMTAHHKALRAMRLFMTPLKRF